MRLVLQVATFIALSRLLPPHDFGLFSMCSVVANFVLLFRDLGTSAALVQRKEINPLILHSVFWLNAGFGLMVTVALVALSSPVSMIFHEPMLLSILPALSLIFLISGVSILHQALLQRQMDFVRLAKIETASALSGSLVAIGFALFHGGVWSLVFQSLAANLCSTILFWQTQSWRPQWKFSWREVRSITTYSLNLSGFNLVNYFSRNADNLLIGRYLGAEQLGYYNLAYKIMLFPLQNISSTVSRVIFPAFSKYQEDNGQISKLYLAVSSTIALVIFPMMLGVFIIGPQIIQVFLGSKWQPAVPLIMALAPVGLIQSIVSLNGVIFGAKGKTSLQFKQAILFGILTVTAFIIGLHWGTIGVAVAYLISNLIFLPLGLFIPIRLIQLPSRSFLSPLGPTLLCSSIMAAVLYLLDQLKVFFFSEIVNLTFLILAGILMYLSASWFWNRSLLMKAWQSLQREIAIKRSSES